MRSSGDGCRLERGSGGGCWPERRSGGGGRLERSPGGVCRLERSSGGGDSLLSRSRGKIWSAWTPVNRKHCFEPKKRKRSPYLPLVRGEYPTSSSASSVFLVPLATPHSWSLRQVCIPSPAGIRYASSSSYSVPAPPGSSILLDPHQPGIPSPSGNRIS